MREEGVLAATPDPEDRAFEESLRPDTLDQFVGQEALKERLSILIEASRQREEAADHVLFSGPPGLGKTTLAMILAGEAGAGPIQETSGPSLARPGDLASIVSNLGGGVLFIDEIHRMPRQIEEILYGAMEDFRLDVVLGKGPSAQSIRLDLDPFTLVGATTRAGAVSPPLRDRFGYIARIDFYPSDELEQIVRRSARILDVAIEDDAAAEIALRSRGTPRIANRLLRRVRDYAEVRSSSTTIERSTALEALDVFEVDPVGLDRVDRAILDAVIHKFGGGPVGLSNLAIAVSEEQQTVEDAYEPFLIQAGYLQRTPRGRIATALAYRHLGLDVPPQVEQGKLL